MLHWESENFEELGEGEKTREGETIYSFGTIISAF